MSMRLLAAVAVLVSAAVHLYLWFDVFSSETVVGPAFLLNAFGGAVIAALLVVWRHWLPPLLAIGFGVSTLTAFVIAATVGLFGVHEHWTGWAVWTAAAAEVVAVVAGRRRAAQRARAGLRCRGAAPRSRPGCEPPLTRCRTCRRPSPPTGASSYRPRSASCRPARCRHRGARRTSCSRRRRAAGTRPAAVS